MPVGIPERFISLVLRVIAAVLRLIRNKPMNNGDGQSAIEMGNEQPPTEDPSSEELLKVLKALNPPDDLMNTVEQIVKDISHLPDKRPHLHEHLRALIKLFKTNPKRVSLQAHIIVSARTFGADNQILRKLKDRGVELTNTDLTHCEFVLLFCVINSRVGADVSAAMRMIPESAAEKPVFLVLMFHTRKKDFPAEGPQWNSEYKNIQFQTEVLFHRTRNGIFQCDRNDIAIEKLLKECHIQNKE